ncbi:MAG: hypothetical protein ACP5D6_06430 [Kosmotogaceae bacterium]
MKVTKVIVDELPESCAHCVLSVGGNVQIGLEILQEWLCPVSTPQHILDEKTMLESRPDWCPLIVEDNVKVFGIEIRKRG